MYGTQRKRQQEKREGESVVIEWTGERCTKTRKRKTQQRSKRRHIDKMKHLWAVIALVTPTLGWTDWKGNTNLTIVMHPRRGAMLAVLSTDRSLLLVNSLLLNSWA